MTASSPALPAGAASVEAPPFRSYAHLVRSDPGEGRQHFYRLQWHPTLWDECALVCIRGRIGTLGHVHVLHAVRTPAAVADADRLVRRRLRHGYRLVDWH